MEKETWQRRQCGIDVGWKTALEKNEKNKHGRGAGLVK